MDLKELLYDRMAEEPVSIGSRLIAEPIMDDTYFSRAVCLIVDKPSSGGHVGLILNKPVDYNLSDLFPYTGDVGKNIPIYCGGPVDLERMTLLHTLGDELGTSFEVLPGLYVGGEVDKVVEYLKSGKESEGKLRFFLGYSGWEEGQLAREISQKSWAVLNDFTSPVQLKGEGVSFWRNEIKKLGDDYRSWLMIPTNPSFN